ncbi:hypothetical protein [Flavobacterium sp. HJSW_4]|uniref:hypothetical protein n=1 Tax=Flavobacterium sp. HJSW_4 TaxID=3344660 RepID=UPI0035F459EC
MELKPLSNESRLIDFIAYILYDYNKYTGYDHILNSFFLPFYKHTEKKTSKITKPNGYEKYLRESLDCKYLVQAISLNGSFEISNEGFKILENYFCTNFSYNSESEVEDYGATPRKKNNLEISISQIKDYLKDYNSLALINDKVFISYYKQIIIAYDDWICVYLRRENRRIKKKYSDSNKINAIHKSEFINYHHRKLIKTYIHEFEFNVYEFVVNMNDDAVDFTVDINKSLIKQLEFLLSFNEIEYENMVLRKEIKTALNEYLIKLFEYHFNKVPFSLTNDLVKTKYSIFYNSKTDYVDFLMKKGFTDMDVKNILNILSNNQFGELGFKFLKRNNLKQIEVFHILYAFYVFDFCDAQNFSSARDFDLVINFQCLKEELDNKQFKKYYENIDNKNSRHYPFSQFENSTNLLLEKIISNAGMFKRVLYK